jgi:hypothetical protein
MREGGQDYAFVYGDKQHIVGGGGSTPSTLLDIDSVVFHVRPAAVEIDLDTTVCEVPFIIHGQSFTESTVTDVAYTTGVYDTIVHLNLTVAEPAATEFNATACGSYEWNGTVYEQSGDYEQTFQTALGCDSVVTLHLTVNQPTSTEFTAMACGSYEWNGTVYEQSGDYEQTLQTALGCDSVVTLHLMVNNPQHEAFTVEACGEYEWNGTVYDQSGDYTYTHPTDNYGCTQVDTLHLTIHNPTHVAYTAMACGSYEWNGTVYEQSGDYTYSHTDDYGCTQVDTLHLDIHNPQHLAFMVEACGSYEWNGTVYEQSGDYTFEHQTDNYGCTQVDTLHLTIHNPQHEAFTVEACGEYEWNGTVYAQSGDYTYTHPTDDYGCTQVDTLHLTVNQSAESADQRTVEIADLPYEWNGVVFTTAGTQIAYLQTAAGCDSTVTMTLTVNGVSEGTQVINVTEVDDNTFDFTVLADVADEDTKVSVNYYLYKDDVLVDDIMTECGGIMNIATEYNGSFHGHNVTSGTGNVPANTFNIASTHFDYLYMHFVNGRANRVTHDFTEAGTYTMLVELVEETGGIDFATVYYANGVSRRIGGKTSAEGGVLATAQFQFEVEAPESGSNENLPMLSLSDNDITQVTSTVNLTCDQNDYDPMAKVSVRYTILRDGEVVSNVMNVASINMATYVPSTHAYYGKTVTEAVGTIPDNTFRPTPSYVYNYFYMNFLANTTNRITTTWNQAGEYSIVFDLQLMQGGSDLAMVWSAGNRLGGKNAAATGTILATTTLNYSIPASGAPMGIDEGDGRTLAVWPNPARDVLNVTLPDNCGDGDVTVTDMSGRVVARLDTRSAENGTTTLNVSTWSAGVYFVNVRTNGTVVTEKFVVTK